MGEIFFSIIIPTYNRSHFLSCTINSIIRQDFKDLEIIVVDDGSIDNTKDLVNEFVKNDARIKYFYQKNSERAIARNNGASKATGKFLIFIDSDDYFSSDDHLKKLHEYLINNTEKFGLYFTGAMLSNGETINTSRDYTLEELNQIDFFLKESVVPARVCLPKTLFDFFEFDNDCILVEDTVLWTAIKEKHPIYYVPIHSVTYFLHEDNSVNIKKTNAYLKRLNGLKKLFDEYDVGKKIPKKSKKHHLNNCYYGISEFYLNNNRFIRSKLWIMKSLFKYPHLDTKHKIKILFN